MVTQGKVKQVKGIENVGDTFWTGKSETSLRSDMNKVKDLSMEKSGGKNTKQLRRKEISIFEKLQDLLTRGYKVGSGNYTDQIIQNFLGHGRVFNFFFFSYWDGKSLEGTKHGSDLIGL